MHIAVARILVPLQNSCIEILTPDVMVFEVGATGRRLGHESRIFTNEISVLIRDPPLPFCHVTLWLEGTLYETGRNSHQRWNLPMP